MQSFYSYKFVFTNYLILLLEIETIKYWQSLKWRIAEQSLGQLPSYIQVLKVSAIFVDL